MFDALNHYATAIANTRINIIFSSSVGIRSKFIPSRTLFLHEPYNLLRSSLYNGQLVISLSISSTQCLSFHFQFRQRSVSHFTFNFVNAVSLISLSISSTQCLSFHFQFRQRSVSHFTFNFVNAVSLISLSISSTQCLSFHFQFRQRSVSHFNFNFVNAVSLISSNSVHNIFL